jgi:A/G-specific adenine glycosylase
MDFSTVIKKWYHSNKRELPWRTTRDPYIIWLSEVILQQTRVEQGMPYYQRFTLKFPTVTQLAAAALDDVLKLWQGLGYYSRARNLHAAAKQVVDEYKGIFPSDQATLLKLKGVGVYTAAAVASIAGGERVAVVDGNVYRVLSRYFGITTPTDSGAGKKEFNDLAQSLLPHSDPGIHNQSIMEFGALQCKPVSPDCENCPLSNTCWAYADDKVSVLPVKTKKIVVRDRYFNYLVIRNKAKIKLRKRTAKDIWNELYEFPLIETKGRITPRKLFASPAFQELVPSSFSVDNVSEEIIHKLSHQTIRATFYSLSNAFEHSQKEDHLLSVPLSKIHEYPVPRLIERYIEDYIEK